MIPIDDFPLIVNDKLISTFIARVITIIVTRVRTNLSYQYDMKNKHKNYAGLCDQASYLFKQNFDHYMRTFFRPTDRVKCIICHGDQKHHPRIHSSFWQQRHTWNEVHVGKRIIYVDCTSGQFKYLYQPIPPYYISEISPPWFIDDRYNKALKRSKRKINQFIKLPIKENGKWKLCGIMDIYSYHIVAGLSNWFGKATGIRKPT